MDDGARGGRANSFGRLLRHPLRQRLLFEYAERVTSPRDVADALGAHLNVVSYHTQVLREAGCLELVRMEQKRGAHQHFYRAVVTSEIHDADWEKLPLRVRRVLVRLTIDEAFREAGDALPCGGMDSRDTHVSRTFLTLDAQGRAALAALLYSTFEAAFEIQDESRRRGAAGQVPCEVIMMSFERASGP